jgi:hypothetical protein
LTGFLKKTDLSFKVKAYNFWDLENEALSCDQFESTFDYLIPNGTIIHMQLACREASRCLIFKVQNN